MENQKNEAIVKLFNKGDRIIHISGGGEISPKKVSDVGKAEAEKLLRLYSRELVLVSEGQDPLAAADSDSAKCASLNKEIEALNRKVTDLERSGNADVVESLQEKIEELKSSIEPLKGALDEVTAEKDQLVKDLDKANKEIAPIKKKRR